MTIELYKIERKYEKAKKLFHNSSSSCYNEFMFISNAYLALLRKYVKGEDCFSALDNLYEDVDKKLDAFIKNTK